jgi:hypothetical protein
MKQLFFIALFTAAALLSNAQTFEGFVKDAKTLAPLSYVNVGIIGKGVGTVTDQQGRFKLSLSNNDADSLRISMVGYTPQTFLVDNIKNGSLPKTTLLQPAVNQLKEVKVDNHKWKQAILGNTTKSKNSNAGFRSNQLGNEIGTIIKIKRSPTFIKEFNAAISVAPLDSVKLRLNFYTVKDGLPDQLLQHENIFVIVRKGQESVKVNLEPYNIIVEDKFCVTLETIQNARGHGLMFSASFFSGSVISRDASQDKWEKVGIAGVGFNVLAEY